MKGTWAQGRGGCGGDGPGPGQGWGRGAQRPWAHESMGPALWALKMRPLYGVPVGPSIKVTGQAQRDNRPVP